jgi:hypothetical protein
VALMTTRTLTATKTKNGAGTNKSLATNAMDKKKGATDTKPRKTLGKALSKTDGRAPTKSARGVKSPLQKTADKTIKALKPVKARNADIESVLLAGKKKKPVAAAKKATSQKPVRARRHVSIASEIAEAMLGEMGLSGEDSALAREAARSQRERDMLSRLAVSVGRNDEMPNLELAADIVFGDDVDAVGTLVGVLERYDDLHAPDAARVLAEVGTRAPDLLLVHSDRLVEIIEGGHKEMLAFTMLALSPVASRYAEPLWPCRDLFWAALADLNQPANMAQSGAVRLLAAMCATNPDYARTLAGGLVDLLGKCMPKDVAFFAESVLPALGAAHSHRAKPVLDRRLKELTPAEVARLRRAQRAAQLGQPLAA